MSCILLPSNGGRNWRNREGNESEKRADSFPGIASSNPDTGRPGVTS